MNHIRQAVSIILWLAFAAASAFATDIAFVGSSGDRQATLEFTMKGAELWITLRNTSTHDAMEPVDMLGGAFFDVANNPVLTPKWAQLDADACFLYPTSAGCSSPVDRNIGGEWAYHHFTSGSPISQNSGIAAVGYSFFDGVADRFDLNQDLDPPPHTQIPIDGGNFSLAPQGDDPTTGIHGLSNTGPYIRFGAVFAFTFPVGYNPASFNPAAAISNVRFQYGTGFCEPWIPGDPVPEPASLALIGGGLIGMGLLRRRFAR